MISLMKELSITLERRIDCLEVYIESNFLRIFCLLFLLISPIIVKFFTLLVIILICQIFDYIFNSIKKL